MFLRKTLFPLLSIFMTSPVYAADCTHSLSEAHMQDFNRYVLARNAENYRTAATNLASLLSKDPNNFCLLYERGRLHVIEKQNDLALVMLNKAKEIASPLDKSNQPIFNIIGYIYLTQEKYEDAAHEFKLQVETPEYGRLPKQDQMKVHNNYGLTLLRLDRYLEAQENFDKAIELGSSQATKNKRIVTSILKVQNNASKKGLPGIFGVAIYSTRKHDDVLRATKHYSNKLNINPEDFQVFKRPNGMLTITYGAFLSYPDAEVKLAELNALSQSGQKVDANIVSVADWQSRTLKY